MRIYGKTLSEIFVDIPWQLKIIILVGVMFIPFAIIRAGYVYLTFGQIFNKPSLTRFNGVPENLGALDPSLTEGDNKKIYMVYTSLKDQAFSNGLLAAFPVTQLAFSNPPCSSWTYMSDLFEPRGMEEIVGPDGATPLSTAIWATETPTAIYDPNDPGKEFKFYAFRYFWADAKNRRDLAAYYGVIVYRSAHDAVKHENWGSEEWLFSAKRGQPPEPYGDLVQYHLNDLDPSLKDIYYYARPSAVMMGDVYYMTLSGFITGRTTADRVIMISSPDRGRTWQYAGTLLKHDDVAKMGPFSELSGGTLFLRKGALYFATVFGGEKKSAAGTFILRFEDPATARLAMNPKTGLPAIVKRVPPNSGAPSGGGGGFATYHDKCGKQGVIVSELSGIKRKFQIFNSAKEPVDDSVATEGKYSSFVWAGVTVIAMLLLMVVFIRRNEKNV